MSIVIAECKYQITRKAPGELVENYPELWKKLSLQRFAWIHLPWLFVFLILTGITYWPSALVFLVTWLWQRNKPQLLVCRAIEILVYVYFTFLVLASVTLVNTLPGGPFTPILIVGAIILFYESSARSWHYLFNYMSLNSTEFLELATTKKWITENKNINKRTELPTIVAISGVILGTVIIIVLELISKL